MGVYLSRFKMFVENSFHQIAQSSVSFNDALGPDIEQTMINLLENLPWYRNFTEEPDR